jgi:hypothetical protein
VISRTFPVTVALFVGAICASAACGNMQQTYAASTKNTALVQEIAWDITGLL